MPERSPLLASRSGNKKYRERDDASGVRKSFLVNENVASCVPDFAGELLVWLGGKPLVGAQHLYVGDGAK